MPKFSLSLNPDERQQVFVALGEPDTGQEPTSAQLQRYVALPDTSVELREKISAFIRSNPELFSSVPGPIGAAPLGHPLTAPSPARESLSYLEGATVYFHKSVILPPLPQVDLFLIELNHILLLVLVHEGNPTKYEYGFLDPSSIATVLAELKNKFPASGTNNRKLPLIFHLIYAAFFLEGDGLETQKILKNVVLLLGEGQTVEESIEKARLVYPDNQVGMVNELMGKTGAGNPGKKWQEPTYPLPFHTQETLNRPPEPSSPSFIISSPIILKETGNSSYYVMGDLVVYVSHNEACAYVYNKEDSQYIITLFERGESELMSMSYYTHGVIYLWELDQLIRPTSVLVMDERDRVYKTVDYLTPFEQFYFKRIVSDEALYGIRDLRFTMDETHMALEIPLNPSAMEKLGLKQQTDLKPSPIWKFPQTLDEFKAYGPNSPEEARAMDEALIPPGVFFIGDKKFVFWRGKSRLNVVSLNKVGDLKYFYITSDQIEIWNYVEISQVRRDRKAPIQAPDAFHNLPAEFTPEVLARFQKIGSTPDDFLLMPTISDKGSVINMLPTDVYNKDGADSTPPLRLSPTAWEYKEIYDNFYSLPEDYPFFFTIQYGGKKLRAVYLMNRGTKEDFGVMYEDPEGNLNFCFLPFSDPVARAIFNVFSGKSKSVDYAQWEKRKNPQNFPISLMASTKGMENKNEIFILHDGLITRHVSDGVMYKNYSYVIPSSTNPSEVYKKGQAYIPRNQTLLFAIQREISVLEQTLEADDLPPGLNATLGGAKPDGFIRFSEEYDFWISFDQSEEEIKQLLKEGKAAAIKLRLRLGSRDGPTTSVPINQVYPLNEESTHLQFDKDFEAAIFRWGRKYLNGPHPIFKVTPTLKNETPYVLEVGLIGSNLQRDPFYTDFLAAWGDLLKVQPEIKTNPYGENYTNFQIFLKQQDWERVKGILKRIQEITALKRKALREEFKKNPTSFSTSESIPTPSIEETLRKVEQNLKVQNETWNPEFTLPFTRNTPLRSSQRSTAFDGFALAAEIRVPQGLRVESYRDWRKHIQSGGAATFQITVGKNGTPLGFNVRKIKSGAQEEYLLTPDESTVPFLSDELKLIYTEGGVTTLKFEKRAQLFQWMQEQEPKLSYALSHSLNPTGGEVQVTLGDQAHTIPYRVGYEKETVDQIAALVEAAKELLLTARNAEKTSFKIERPVISTPPKEVVTPPVSPRPSAPALRPSLPTPPVSVAAPPPSPPPAPVPPPKAMGETTHTVALRLKHDGIDGPSNQVVITITTLTEEDVTFTYLSEVKVNGVKLSEVNSQGKKLSLPADLSYPFSFSWEGEVKKEKEGIEAFTVVIENEKTMEVRDYRFEPLIYVRKIPLQPQAQNDLGAALSALPSPTGVSTLSEKREDNWNFIKPGMVFSPTADTLRTIQDKLGIQGGIDKLEFENEVGLVMEIPIFYNPSGSRSSNPFYLDGERSVGFYLKGQRNTTWQAVPKSFRAQENRGNWVFYAIEKGGVTRAKAFQLELVRPPALEGRVCPVLFGLVATHSKVGNALEERTRHRKEAKKNILLKLESSLSILAKKKLASVILLPSKLGPSVSEGKPQEIVLKGAMINGVSTHVSLKGIASDGRHILLKETLFLEIQEGDKTHRLQLSYEGGEEGVLLLKEKAKDSPRIFRLDFNHISEISLEEIIPNPTLEEFWKTTTSFGPLEKEKEKEKLGRAPVAFENPLTLHFPTDVPYLPSHLQSVEIPPTPSDGFFKDVPPEEELEKNLEGLAFIPTEESLWAQVLGGREEETLNFVTKNGGAILQVQMRSKKSNGVSYQAADPAQPLAPLKARLLLPLEGTHEYYELETVAVSNSTNGNENIELRVDVGGEAVVITLTQVTTAHTFNHRGVMGYMASLKGKTANKKPGQRKLEALIQFFSADKKPALGAPEGLDEPDLNVETVGENQAQLEGVDVSEDGEAKVGLSSFYRASDDSALFYLQQPTTQNFHTMKISGEGRLLFWPRRPDPREIYNPPTATAHAMRRIDGKEYKRELASAATRLQLNPLGTEKKRFVITQPLGREEGSVADEATAGIGDLPLFRFEVWEDEKGRLHGKPGTISDLEKEYGDYFPFGEDFEIQIQEDVFLNEEGKLQNGKVRVIAKRLEATNQKGVKVVPYLMMVFENREKLIGAPSHFAIEVSHFHEIQSPPHGKKKSMPSEPGFLYGRAGLELDTNLFSVEDIFKGLVGNASEGEDPEYQIRLLLGLQDNGSDETVEVLLGVLEEMEKFKDGKYADKDLATLAYHTFITLQSMGEEAVLKAFNAYKSGHPERRVRGHTDHSSRSRRPDPRFSPFGSSADYLPARTSRRVPAQPIEVPQKTVQPDNSRAYDLVEDAIEILEKMSVSGKDAAVRRKLVERLESYLRDEESLVKFVDDFYAEHLNSGAKDLIAFLSQREGLVFQGPGNYFFTLPHGAGNVPVMPRPTPLVPSH